ncbi:MAG: hypothetical protein HYZ75_03225 [Elusimicrobia bacterium]|nr:hypothetical protein [Elusimicrobiota bacterium]
MRTRALLAVLLAAAAACSGPDTRIKRRQAAFDAYPPAVQETIRAGKVEIGFTREQAELALGKPDRRYTRKTAAGEQDVWAYGGGGSARPRLGLGIGVGSYGGGGAYSGGVGIGRGESGEDRLRVVFQGDAVTGIEERSR